MKCELTFGTSFVMSRWPRALAWWRPVPFLAVASRPGARRLGRLGEVSAAGEGFGIHPGMRMGEALARCPRLALVPADPVGVADAWERALAALEAAGAMVEPGRPGLACFEARGLRRLHGGSLEGV